jgi:hypothetical protein
MPDVLKRDGSGPGVISPARRFEFGRDTFAFSNGLIWEYEWDANGKMTGRPRKPRPDYTHHCFVMTRTARQFHFHSRFDAEAPVADDQAYRRLVRQIVSRNPRRACGESEKVVFPGFSCLREFSAARSPILKQECGGAWRSYVLPSHWRMVFPISREHQERTAEGLCESLSKGVAPMLHLVSFPSLRINHGMLTFDVCETPAGLDFITYDPNDAEKPCKISYDRQARQFTAPTTDYWPGGKLDIIEICKKWYL